MCEEMFGESVAELTDSFLLRLSLAIVFAMAMFLAEVCLQSSQLQLSYSQQPLWPNLRGDKRM